MPAQFGLVENQWTNPHCHLGSTCTCYNTIFIINTRARPGVGLVLSVLAIKIGLVSESLELAIAPARFVPRSVNAGLLPFPD